MADYVLEGPRWSTRSITWSFASPGVADASTPFSSAIGDAYKGYVQAAFDTWSAASGLRFTQVADSTPGVNIRVGFGRIPGGDIGLTNYYYYVSQPGTFAPGTAVRVLDPQLYAWTDTELRHVFIHEVGHALGLDHTYNLSSVMYPTADVTTATLGAGDVAGIQALYPQARLSAPATFSVPFARDRASLVGGADGSLTVSGPGISQAVLESGTYRIGFLNGTAVFDATGSAGTAARLYQTAFGRGGDAGGVAYWTQALRDGTSPLAVARAFIGSTELSARGLSDAGFVATLYRNALGREPDAGGLQTFTRVLATGTERAQVLLTISQSAEAKEHLRATAGDAAQAEAYRLYDTVLGRTPDAGGLAYFGDTIARGAAPVDVARSMLASAEATSRYGGLSNRDFAASMYRNALDREPDAGGLAWTQGRLDQGASRAQVAVGLADSTEARRLTAAVTHDGWVWLG